jgi:hypothetical protein
VEIAPLAVHLYRVLDPRPVAELLPPQSTDGVRSPIAGPRGERPGQIAFTVRAPHAASLVVREGFDPGWSARVDGRPAAITVAPAGHMILPVPAGESQVSMSYRPRRLGLLVLLTAGAALAVVALWLLGTAPRPSAPA